MWRTICDIIEICILDTETFDTFSNPWNIFELYRKEDIDALRNQFLVTKLNSAQILMGSILFNASIITSEYVFIYWFHKTHSFLKISSM